MSSGILQFNVRWVGWSSLIAAGFGILTLLGWASGWDLLASFGGKLIPMAPSTAVLFAWFGTVIYLQSAGRLDSRLLWAVLRLSCLAALVSFLLLMLSLQGIYSSLEYLGMEIAGLVEGAPIGHMSPMTAFCFILTGLSFLSLNSNQAASIKISLFGVSAAVILTFTSLVFLLAYIAGAPMLYGGIFVPPALNTVLSFLLLGVPLVLLSKDKLNSLIGPAAQTGIIQRLYLFLVMMGIALAMGSFSIFTLFFSALENKKIDLVNIVKTQASIIEAVARFNKQYSSGYPGGHIEATLSQIKEAHQNFVSFGKTGELTLAELDGGQIHFLLRRQSAKFQALSKSPQTLPVGEKPAEPMRRALQGKSGTMVGMDYRGHMVLAAYEPVETLNFGLVAKIDLSEIRKPFFNAVLSAGAWGLFIILIAAVFFFRISDQILRKLGRSNRALSALSKTNSILLHAKSESFILSEMCKMIVSEAGYLMVWVGYAEHDKDKTVCPMAQAGFDPGYLEKINITWADNALGRGPTGMAIRAKKPFVMGDILNDPLFLPWRAEAIKKGYASSVALPLIIDGKVLGALNIYARDPNAFDSEEIVLLQQLAEDLSFGIKVLRGHLARETIEKTLKENEERLELVLEGADIGSWDWYVQTDHVFFSDRLCGMLGYAQNEMGPKLSSWEKLVHPDDMPRVLKALDDHLQGKTEHYETEHRLLHKSGHWIWVLDKGKVVERDSEGNPLRACGTHLDITERKEMEQASARLNRIVEDSVNEIYIFDGGTLQFNQVNSHARGNLGYSMDELRGMTPIDLNPEYSEARFRGLIAPLMAGEKDCIAFETFHERKDKTTYPIEVRLQYFKEENPPVFMGLILDITERKQSEALLETVFQALPDLFFRMKEDGTILDCRGQNTSDLYIPPEKFIGKRMQDVLPPDLRRMITINLEQAFKTGQLTAFEYMLTVPKGQRCFEARLSRLFDTDQLIMVVRDITDARQMAERARKLTQAVEQSPESVIITNLDAEIEYVNEAFERHTGYSREEVMGKNPRLLKSGKTPPETFAAMWDALKSGRMWKGEISNRRKDGTEYTDFAIISPIRQPDGSITHYVAAQEDITSKKKLAQELDDHRHHLEELVEERTAELVKALEEAESANQAKSQFLSTMSHELRTPLNSIIGFGDLLKGRHFGDINDKQEGYIGHILTSGRHLLELINDLLDIAKIDAGSITLELEKISLEESLANAADLMSSQFKQKDIKVKIHIDPALNIIICDPMKFKQIMLNLLSNAMKYSYNSGSIDIRAVKKDYFVRISVADSGVGIPKKDQKGIFSEFYQVDRVRDENLGGTGIGLALVRRLVELHGGDIGVDSEPGMGATIWFTLPERQSVNPDQTIKGNTLEEPAVYPMSRRILVVEDNDINLTMVIEMLSIHCHEVFTARNGKEAIDMAQSCNPELILMDIRMPVMDGLEATRKLRTMPGFERLPIIALTASVGEEIFKKCLAAGCTDQLNKPVNSTDMFKMLERYLNPPAASKDAS